MGTACLMKKFHVKITIEHEETWIISPVGETNEAAFAKHERDVQRSDHSPKRLHQNFSDRLIGWIKRFRLSGKKEINPNSVLKNEEKYVQK